MVASEEVESVNLAYEFVVGGCFASENFRKIVTPLSDDYGAFSVIGGITGRVIPAVGNKSVLLGIVIGNLYVGQENPAYFLGFVIVKNDHIINILSLDKITYSIAKAVIILGYLTGVHIFFG